MRKVHNPIKREPTGYPGTYSRDRVRPDGKVEKVFYISYRRGDRVVEEAVGGSFTDGMTAAAAATIRGTRVKGELSPSEKKAEQTTKWTLDRLWKAWMEDPENQGKRGTIKADQRYRKHISAATEDAENRQKDAPPPLGGREPSDLKPMDLDRLRLYLAKSRSKETTKSVLSLIRRIERYGASKNLCPGIPFPIILKGKALGRDPEVKSAPTDEQVEKFVQTCEAWPDVQAGHFMLFVAFTGVRRGSVRNLKWQDINFDNRTAVLRDSKTGDISVVLSDAAVDLLRKHPKTEGSDYVFSGKGWSAVLGDDGSPVLHKKNGAMRRRQRVETTPQLTQRQVDRIPRKIADAAGLPSDLDPCHCFRRRLATKIEGAFGVATAQMAGGWKTPAMVLHYASVGKQTVRDAVNLLYVKKA